MLKRIVLFVLFFTATSTLAIAGVQIKKSTFAVQENDIIQADLRSALNTHTGKTLVVWERYTIPSGHDQILGRLVDSSGKTLKSPFVLVADPTAFNPVLAYNPVQKEFLLVYDSGPYANLYGLRLNSKGKPIGSPFNITPISDPFQSLYAKIAFNPATKGYAIVYLQINTNGAENNALVGLLLDSKGKAKGRPVLIRESTEKGFYAEPSPLQLEYSPSGDRLFLLYRKNVSRQEGGGINYWLGRLDPLLRNVKRSNSSKINTNSVFFQTGDRGAYLAQFPDDSAYVFYVEDDGIKRRTLNSSGRVSGAPSPAFEGSLQNVQLYDPTVAVSTTTKESYGLLIAIEEGDFFTGDTQWGQFFDTQGNPVGDPVRLTETEPNTISHFGSLLFALPAKPTQKDHRFNWYGTIVLPLNEQTAKGGITNLKVKFSE